MKIRLTKYTHAFIFTMIGVWFVAGYPWIWTSFLGGLLIGNGLKMARQSGEEDGRG